MLYLRDNLSALIYRFVVFLFVFVILHASSSTGTKGMLHHLFPLKILVSYLLCILNWTVFSSRDESSSPGSGVGNQTDPGSFEQAIKNDAK